jgi:coenzyme PQQ precursor peptide PqqA
MRWSKPIVNEFCVGMEVTGYISDDEVPPEF